VFTGLAERTAAALTDQGLSHVGLICD